MKATVKDEWVAALRSGDYTQGTGFLNKGGCFCCLGVLLDITAPDKWVVSEQDPDIFGMTHHDDSEWINPEFNEGELDVDFLLNMGLDDNMAGTLMNMNDGDKVRDGKSFIDIADYIEETL